MDAEELKQTEQRQVANLDRINERIKVHTKERNDIDQKLAEV